jgi:hypothetical protein
MLRPAGALSAEWEADRREVRRPHRSVDNEVHMVKKRTACAFTRAVRF